METLSPQTEASHKTKVPPPVLPKPFVIKNGRKTMKGLMMNTQASVNPKSPNVDQSHRVLQGLERQRIQGLLCDVTLVAGGHQFRVHRAVLAASSEYFWDLFSREKLGSGGIDLNIRGDESAEIVLDDVESGVLEILVRYMYTGYMCMQDLRLDVLREALSKAREFQIDGVATSCAEFLHRKLGLENCVQIYLIARENILNGLRLAVEKYIMENFSHLMTSECFLGLELEDLLALINSRNLKLKCRLALHNASQKWLDHDADRMQHYEEVEGHVLSTPMRIVLGDMTRHSNATGNIVEETEHALEPVSTKVIEEQNSALDCSTWVTRTQQTVILAFGGEDKQGLPSERGYQLHPLSGCCEPYHAMPIRRLDLALTPLGDQIFVAGGQYSSDSHASDSIGTVHCFDAQTESWRQMHPMLKRRALFTLDTIGDRIYAVGGKNAQGSLASVECFDPEMNEWNYTAPLVIPTFGHASAVHDGKLYMTGGVVIGKHFTNTLQCYDPAADIWSYRCPMGTKRALHAMCAIGDKLYVLGGNTRSGRGKRVDCEVVERYNFETDQWMSAKPMPRPVCLAGVASLGHCIYVIGGYNGRLAMRHGDIQCYDTVSDEWSRIGQLPEPLMRLSTCTLSLPTMQSNADRASTNQRNRSGSTVNSELSSEGSTQDS